MSLKVLPDGADWINDKAASFDPDSNVVKLASGEEVEYDWLVVAMGIQLNYHKVDIFPMQEKIEITKS